MRKHYTQENPVLGRFILGRWSVIHRNPELPSLAKLNVPTPYPHNYSGVYLGEGHCDDPSCPPYRGEDSVNLRQLGTGGI
jgi:hypothetical protein